MIALARSSAPAGRSFAGLFLPSDRTIGSFGSIAPAIWCKICRAPGVTFMRIPAFAGALLLLVTMSARAEDHGVHLVKTSILMPDGVRSEERRVGKECRSR